MNNVLIIEDEFDIGELLKTQLEIAGLHPHVIRNGNDALKEINDQGEKYQLFIIDWMLPEFTGIELCKCIRENNNTQHIPVLMVTALTQPENIIEGLDAGADDYITKPFDMDVLLARARAQLRRNQIFSSTKDQTVIEFFPLRIDFKKCQVLLGESPISLTKTEYEILGTLAKDPGHVFTREQLIKKILGDDVHVTNRTIDTHVAGLRKKLGEASSFVETIRGIGYRFTDIHETQQT
ncbi:MAG: response regulator transcription factor [Halobacteriovoraceae bacterium]|nr:response regulator transcription factor [Halobacteriovoraceae bacterium]MCB9093844.1 response regulator transcription factor [Halobacteriovoraceae bacterium]